MSVHSWLWPTVEGVHEARLTMSSIVFSTRSITSLASGDSVIKSLDSVRSLVFTFPVVFIFSHFHVCFIGGRTSVPVHLQTSPYTALLRTNRLPGFKHYTGRHLLSTALNFTSLNALNNHPIDHDQSHESLNDHQYLNLN
jgi:hypothetical protein